MSTPQGAAPRRSPRDSMTSGTQLRGKGQTEERKQLKEGLLQVSQAGDSLYVSWDHSSAIQAPIHSPKDEAA